MIHGYIYGPSIFSGCKFTDLRHENCDTGQGLSNLKDPALDRKLKLLISMKDHEI